jgi:hypothetical protein
MAEAAVQSPGRGEGKPTEVAAVRPLETLPVGRRKFCVGRWLGMLALAEDSPVAIDIEEQDTAQGLLGEARDEANLANARRDLESMTVGAISDDAEPMPAFLDRLVGTVQNASPSGGAANHAAALRRRIDAYIETPDDPFGTLFDAACDVASAFYADQQLPVDTASTRCELGVAAKGIPHKLPMGAAVGGGLRPTVTGTVAKVSLTADAFWRPEMCAIFYVMLHELVVHAFAAPHAQQSGDGFAEGWMDFVAYDLHEQFSTGQLAQGSPLPREFPRSDQRYQAQVLHTARSAGREVIAAGKIAAQLAEGALQAEHGPDVAREMLWAFSAALNRSALPPSVRSEACEQLGRAFTTGAAVAKEWVEVAGEIHAESDGIDRIRIAERFVPQLTT